jgi:hypothetical protein
MPVVFLGAGAAPADSGPARWLATAVITLAAAGAVVGAIHGFVLLRWLRAHFASSTKHS